MVTFSNRQHRMLAVLSVLFFSVFVVSRHAALKKSHARLAEFKKTKLKRELFHALSNSRPPPRFGVCLGALC